MSETKSATKKLTLWQKIMAVQLGLKPMTKNKPGFNYKYFDVNQQLEQLKLLLKEYGLIVIQPLSNIEGKPALKLIVISGDEKYEDIMPLPVNSTKSRKLDKNGQPTDTIEEDPQKMGSSITYFRRYQLQSFFLMESEDDDAKSAVNR